MKLEYIFVFFALLGALDKIFGNRFKLGDEFEKGILTIGPLVISMAGMIVLAPVMSEVISWVALPVLSPLGIDLSFVGAFFPVDAGGAVIAYEISENTLVRGYNGIIIASMFGATICPVIPMALKMVEKQYHEDVLTGLLCGIATIPIGCVVSGFIIGCPLKDIILNTFPIIILATLICLGLVKKTEFTRRLFGVVGIILSVLVVFGLAVGILDKLTGIKLCPSIESIDESFLIIGNIAIILSGVFPLLAVIRKVFGKAFAKLGEFLKTDSVSVLGIVTSLANSIPVFSMMKDMDKKGRIMNMAFAVSGAYVLGDHLAFALSYDRNFVLPMVVGKLISGIASLVMAHFIHNNIIKNKENNIEI